MQLIIITKKDANQRIDKFIKKYLANAPLSLIYKLFRKKDIKVNGKKIPINYIIQETDEVSIYLSDEYLNLFIKNNNFTKEEINFEIVFEDKNLLIVNKPAGLLVHQGNKTKYSTLNNQVLNYLYDKKEYNNEDVFKPSAVHRLDRNTSGLIIIAKNLISNQILAEMFKNKENIKTEYITIVKGITNKKELIEKNLLKNETSNLVKVDEKKGLKAITEFEKILSNNNYSLLRVRTLTGRSHQIRVHLASIDHPIINDVKYGDKMLNKQFNLQYNYPFQILIADKIIFKEIKGHLSYLSNKIFNAPLDNQIKKIIKLEFNHSF